MGMKIYPRQNRKVFIAMSGGVDSSVAAALLKERGFNVCGVHIKMWSDPDIPCAFKEDRYDAMRVAAKLDIPFETWDFTEEYKIDVVEYMIREYAKGRTPNPDVMCNRHIKFGVFLKKALEHGADFAATGHYVRREPEFPTINYQLSNKSTIQKIENSDIENSLKIENCKLKIAKDTNKDQSYFLWTLTQEQLKNCLFPIGDYTKPEVREMARRFGLPTAEKQDSQGICFIGELEMREFLRKYIPRRPGPIVTSGGKNIGEHDGLAYYTIGQRQGLGIGGGIPYYVAEKDFAANTLVVAEGPYDEKLFSKEFTVEDVNWISGERPKLPLRCEVRIRHRQPLQHCSVEGITNDRLLVTFDEPQRAVTPGQSAVFYFQASERNANAGRLHFRASAENRYKEGEMLGGGVIN